MRKDKGKAIEMRRAGKSYAEIHKKLGIPLSTLSDWLKNEGWSQTLRHKLASSAQNTSAIRLINLNKIRSARLTQAYAEAQEEARKELEGLKYNPMFISGVMLYWGQGDKNPKQGVKFVSHDPKMVRFYVSFLTETCHIPLEKVRAYIVLYPQIEERTGRAYWSKMSGVPWENFTKSVVFKGRSASRRLGWGTCTITVSSTYFKQKMLAWIDLLPKELMDTRYYESISEQADMV